MVLAAACQPAKDGKEAGKQHRTGHGLAFSVVEGKVIDPPEMGSAFRSAVAAFANAAFETSTCRDEQIKRRRAHLLGRAERAFNQLRRIGLASELEAGRSDFYWTLREELRVGCSLNPDENASSLAALELHVGQIEKWAAPGR